MRFALINGKCREAIRFAHRNFNCRCRFCDDEVVARCGEKKMHHWAHKSGKHCDEWHEPETEWHRKWKSEFPESWQEVRVTSKRDETWHIADIRTPQRIGLVVEMQHSPITPDEMRKRSDFYYEWVSDIWWIVDCARLSTEYDDFVYMLTHFAETIPSHDSPDTQMIYHTNFCKLLDKWADLGDPIAFDLHDRGIWFLYDVSENQWPDLKPGRWASGYFQSRQALVEEMKEVETPRMIARDAWERENGKYT